jgi:hypothetical protein
MIPYLTTLRITESIFAEQFLEFVFSIICSVELFFDDSTGYHFQFEFPINPGFRTKFERSSYSRESPRLE